MLRIKKGFDLAKLKIFNDVYKFREYPCEYEYEDEFHNVLQIKKSNRQIILYTSDISIPIGENESVLDALQFLNTLGIVEQVIIIRGNYEI